MVRKYRFRANYLSTCTRTQAWLVNAVRQFTEDFAMDNDNNRVLLTLEQHRKNINREKINAEVQIAEVGNIQPVLEMVAEQRAAYIKALFDLASERDGLPTPEQIDNLTQLRKAYSEVVDAANAMEVAIERGYVDVKSV